MPDRPLSDSIAISRIATSSIATSRIVDPGWLKAFAILVVLGVPAVQLSFGPAWMYTGPSIDPWVYHGYFLHLPTHAVDFNGTYYGGRLAWILPGYLAHHFFNPLLANLCLRLFLYWTSVLSAFFLVYRSYGERCALVTSLLLCGSAGFLMAIGWDYVDGAGIAYGLLCLEELSATAAKFPSAPRRAIWRAVIAGAAFAGAVYSNIMLLSFAPAMVVFFLVRAGWRGLAMGIPALAGFGGVTAFLGYISLRLGGAFLFFMPSALLGRALLKSNSWFVSGLKWTAHAWWLVTPGIVSLLALAWLIQWALRRRNGSAEAVDLIRAGDALCLVMTFTLFAVLTALRNPILQLHYYTSYLTIFTVAATGALIGRRLDSWRIPNFLGLVAACILLSIGAGVGTGLWTGIPFVRSVISGRLFTVLGGSEVAFTILFAVIITGAESIKYRAVSTVISMISVAVVLLHVAPVDSASGTVARDLYLDVSRSSRELGALTAGQPLWFWYDDASDSDGRSMALASTYLWGYRLLSRRLPDTTNLFFNLVHPGSYVAVLERNPATRAEALKNLERGGLSLKRIADLKSPIATSNFALTLVQVTSVAAPLAP